MSHIKIGQAVLALRSNEFRLISIISILISIISQSHSCGTPEPLVRFYCVIHENAVEFCVDFKSGVRNIKFLIAKIFIFLTYANLYKLGDYSVNITFQHAEPPEDQICQVSLQYHNLHRFYGKSPHQLLRSFGSTHIIDCKDEVLI